MQPVATRSAKGLLRYGLVAAAALAAGVLVGRATEGDGVTTVVGTADVNFDGAAIGLGNEGYLVGNGLVWQDLAGSWHDGGQPECLPPLSSGARVELGLRPGPNEVTGQIDQVLWVRCLSGPTRRN